MRRLLLFLTLVAGWAAGLAAAGCAQAATAPLYRISDPRIDEASGIAAGIRSPGVVYVQNDSGDSARFFALDAATGRVLAQYDVPGASAVDWEDIAVAPDADGTPSVWLADIGDNMHDRRSVQLYRVPEPSVDRTRYDQRLSTGRPQVWRLRYPSGPVDAESLAVSPAGVPYVVTKALDGSSVVYRVPPGGGTLRRIGAIQFHFTGTPGPFAPLGQIAATGATMSRDGTRFVVRTYTDAYVWSVHGGDVAAALRTAPTRIPLPRQPQGEGICLLGRSLLIDSEGADAPVFRVPLPTAAAPPPRRTSTSAPSSPRSRVPSASSQPPSRPAGDAESTSTDALTDTLAVIAGAAIVGLAVTVTVAARRRR